MTLDKIEQKMPDFEFEKLVSLWHNALAYSGREKANRLLSSVENEWQYREVDIVVEPLWDGPPFDAPEQGLLGTLGYHVGVSHGLKSKLRRAILSRIVVAKLPILHSSSYMSEWGKPFSWTRKSKLMRSVANLIEGKHNVPIYKNAVKNWGEDLGFLEKNFYGEIGAEDPLIREMLFDA
jgi:hypothetical protein